MKVFSLQAPIYRGAWLSSRLTAQTSQLAAVGKTRSNAGGAPARAGSRPRRRPAPSGQAGPRSNV